MSTQQSIWREDAVTVIADQCVLVDKFIDHTEGESLFRKIIRKAQWSQQTIRIFDKSVQSPRLTAWYGEKDAIYRYSGITNIPNPWFEELALIRGLVESYIGQQFNSVLLNYYRDGDDSMGSHSDNEVELGENPVIASLSLGDSRRFIFHSKHEVRQPSIKIELSHGSLLIMSGSCQQYWKHSVPKTKLQVGPRINLTYRHVKVPQI